jgi:hypothetical protein
VVFRFTRTTEGVYRTCEVLFPKRTPEIDAGRCDGTLLLMKRRGEIVDMNGEKGAVVEVVTKRPMITKGVE